MSTPNNKRRTLADFLVQARLVHGEKYDYSEAVYVTSPIPLRVICPSHGPFMQSPSNHLAGKGCRKCASQTAGDHYRKSGDSFVDEAKKVHGDKYDYQETQYRTARIGVTIRCRTHGPFEQAPYVHLGGSGCPQCSNEATGNRSRMTTEEFIALARKKYSEKFDYALVQYVDAWTPVQIRCPTHRQFLQTPAAHLHNTAYGCPQCAHDDATNRGRGPRGARPQDRSNTTAFIERATVVHSCKYDYSLVKYQSSKEKVTIICKSHGPFAQDASGHLSGSGCPKCGNELISSSQRQSVESFIARARTVHGDKFDYSKVVYETARRPVTIICPVHGGFEQVPDKHLRYGCRKCADHELPGAYTEKRFTENVALGSKNGTLYYVRFSSDDGEIFYKVGISQNKAKQRFAGYKGSYGYDMEVIREITVPMRHALAIEQEILLSFAKMNQHLPRRKSRAGRRFGGKNECFSIPLPRDLLQLIDRAVLGKLCEISSSTSNLE